MARRGERANRVRCGDGSDPERPSGRRSRPAWRGEALRASSTTDVSRLARSSCRRGTSIRRNDLDTRAGLYQLSLERIAVWLSLRGRSVCTFTGEDMPNILSIFERRVDSALSAWRLPESGRNGNIQFRLQLPRMPKLRPSGERCLEGFALPRLGPHECRSPRIGRFE